MKYYNKDYASYINDDDAEKEIDKEVEEIRQIDEAYKKIEKSRSIFKSPLDVYRERHNGFPSNLIFFASLLATFIIMAFIWILFTIVIVNWNLANYVFSKNVRGFIAPVMFVSMIIILLLILHFIRPLVQSR